MLASVRTLQELGFKLYASPGTADFYTEHGIKVSHPHYLLYAWISERARWGQSCILIGYLSVSCPLGIFLIAPARKISSFNPAVFLRDRTPYEQKFSRVYRLKQWTGLSRRVEMEQTSEAFWTIWHKTSLTWWLTCRWEPRAQEEHLLIWHTVIVLAAWLLTIPFHSSLI